MSTLQRLKKSTFGIPKFVHYSEVISIVSFIQSVLYQRLYCSDIAACMESMLIKP